MCMGVGKCKSVGEEGGNPGRKEQHTRHVLVGNNCCRWAREGYKGRQWCTVGNVGV